MLSAVPPKNLINVRHKQMIHHEKHQEDVLYITISTNKIIKHQK